MPSAQAQARCTRHAFEDGQCVRSGCRNCPGEAEIAVEKLVAERRPEPAGMLFTIIFCSALFGLAFMAAEAAKQVAIFVAAKIERE